MQNSVYVLLSAAVFTIKLLGGVIKPTKNKMEKQLIINAISSLTGLFSVLTGAGKSDEASEVSKKILELVKEL